MVVTSDIALSGIALQGQSIFLAGSMDIHGKTNWRDRAITQFEKDYHIFDPTNGNHAHLNDNQMREHIRWEWDALKLCDLILLNFLPQAKSPISLVELGMYITSGKIVVVCPMEFYESLYVHTLCAEHGVPVFESFDEVLKTNVFHLIQS